jgi:hypothetical protein
MPLADDEPHACGRGHISIRSLSATLAKSTQLQPAGQPAEQTISFGKQMLMAG